MASDSQDCRRKHRRSPSDDESQDQSKRHKHRHHRHHRRHHKHRSKKHDYEEEAIEKMEAHKERGGFEEVKESNDKVVSKGIADYDEMEEGEIVEDGEIVGSEVEIGGIKGGLDTDTSDDQVSELENSNKRIAKEDVGHQSNEGSFRAYGPSTGRIKRKDRHGSDGEQQNVEAMDVDESELRSAGELKSRRSNGNRHERLSLSPPHRRHNEEIVDRSMSNSSEDLRNKFRSHHEGDDKYNNDTTDHDSGHDEKMIEDKRVKDLSSRRHDKQEPRHHDHESRARDSDEVYRDRRKKGCEKEGRSLEREKGIVRSKYRDHEKVKGREEVQKWNQDVVSDLELDKDRGSGNDHRGSREIDFESERRENSRASNQYRDMEKGWGKEKDGGRCQDMDYERDRRRDSSRSSYRDRDVERVWELENARGRSRERDYERERRRDNSRASHRDREMGREWEERSRDKKLGRERERERSRWNTYEDKLRDAERYRRSRHHRYDDYDVGYGDRGSYHDSRRRGCDEGEYHGDFLEEDYNSKDDSEASKNKLDRDESEQKDYEEVVELKSPEQEEEDIEKIKEESRRRKEAILKKYKAQQLQQAECQIRNAGNELVEKTNQTTNANAFPDNNDIKGQQQDANVAENLFTLGKSPLQNGTAAAEKPSGVAGLGEGTPKSERSGAMFCDDIFGDSPAGARKVGKGDSLTVERSGLRDNWDDPEGYYSHRLGEILDGRYEIVAAHGKGVFSTVVRAKDLKAGIGDPEEVAIKVIRNNETMLKAGMEELIILKKLVGADPDNRRHCVRFISSFKYRNHLCLVFESLHMNLREVLKKFGRNIGLKLTAVRAYAKQLFIALKHLRNCGVLHCDIKPDNMLVNDAKNVLKLCDFGNAMFAGKNEITPYLVSRFYRAPEIILGLPYDHPMDIWSVGCCLYELYTGKVLFPGHTNNDMLRLHMELKGPFPKKMLRKGGFTDHHFDQDLNFLATEEDPITKKEIRKLMVNIKPKDIGSIIKGSPGEDPKMLANFKDLLDKIFVLDPDKRLTVSQALSHPFITGK